MVELARFKFDDNLDVILRDSSGKYILRGIGPDDTRDLEFATGIELLAVYFQFRDESRYFEDTDGYLASMDRFMKEHFTEEQWALAVLDGL